MRIFHTYWDVTINNEGLQNCLACVWHKEGGVFTLLSLLWHRASDFIVLSQGLAQINQCCSFLLKNDWNFVIYSLNCNIVSTKGPPPHWGPILTLIHRGYICYSTWMYTIILIFIQHSKCCTNVKALVYRPYLQIAIKKPYIWSKPIPGYISSRDYKTCTWNNEYDEMMSSWLHSEIFLDGSSTLW